MTQEPRLLSQFSQDENMINAYKQGKDLYATIASGVYHNKYEDNLEFDPRTNQPSADGAARRTSVKSLLLGESKDFELLTLKIMPLINSNIYSNNNVNRDYKRVCSLKTMLTVRS